MSENKIFVAQVQDATNTSLDLLLSLGLGFNFNVSQTAANVTLVPGQAVLVNTNGVVITLPSTPSPGNVCAISTAAGINNVLINAVTIMSLSGNVIINRPNLTCTLLYYNSTQGWTFI